MYSANIQQLIEQLRILPGVGPKTAQRMAFHVLANNRRQQARHLACALETAVSTVKNCERCRNYCETTLCSICTSERRDPTLLCVTESPQDVIAIEQTGSFKGQYFVLHGRLSPLDGIGPKDIGLDRLLKRITEAGVIELIIATNSTVEGEATAHYIAQQAKPLNIICSRIAHGVPMGGELEYLDGNTLSYALQARIQLKQTTLEEKA